MEEGIHEMKKFAVLTALGLLGGCSDPGDVETSVSEEATAAAEPGPADPSMWDSLEDFSGSYRLVYDDGVQGTLTLRADGAVEAEIDSEPLTATFTVPEPGKACYADVSPEVVMPQCWTNGTAEPDGSWVSTGDDGATVVVSPIRRAAITPEFVAEID